MSASWASGTASTRTTTRAPRSSRRPPTTCSRSSASNDPLLEIAKGLEEIALADDYFIERKLYPNVDFYTGLIYKAMGFATKMFTVLFAIGRLPGWIAQWREMMTDPETKIGRPRQIYTGATERKYRARRPLSTEGPEAPADARAAHPSRRSRRAALVRGAAVGLRAARCRRVGVGPGLSTSRRWSVGQPDDHAVAARRAGALHDQALLSRLRLHVRSPTVGRVPRAVVLGVGHGPRRRRPGAHGRGSVSGDRPARGPPGHPSSA